MRENLKLNEIEKVLIAYGSLNQFWEEYQNENSKVLADLHFHEAMGQISDLIESWKKEVATPSINLTPIETMIDRATKPNS